jgi:hypothetical protein
VYAAVTQLGQIFNVPNVAKVLNADIRNDFAVAKAALKKSGVPSLKAVFPRALTLLCVPNSNFIPNPNLTPINP